MRENDAAAQQQREAERRAAQYRLFHDLITNKESAGLKIR
jgi:hypothetical protein